MADEHQVLRELGRQAADELGDGPDEASRQAQRRSLESLVRMRRPSVFRRVALPAAACLLFAGLTFLALWWLDQSKIEFKVGATEEAGQVGILYTARMEPLDFRFDDDTRLELAEETTGKVFVEETKIKLVMGPGKVHARVNKKTKNTWTVQAGPYQVTAVGTRFTVIWLEEGSCLDVSVTEGRVLVTGHGIAMQGRGLSAGQKLHLCDEEKDEHPVAGTKPADHAVADLLVDPEPDPSKKKPLPRGPSVDRLDPVADPLEPTKVASLDDHAPESWLEFHDLNQHVLAVKKAEQEGLDRILKDSDPRDLWHLAESARLTRRGKVATRTLMALRARAAPSSRARLAAFLLGRVALEIRNQPAIAADWFGIYLEEDPKGPLVEEALGRRLQALVAAGKPKEAREAAKAYIKVYPDGSYAVQAAQVLSP